MANSNVIYSQFEWASLPHKQQLSLMDEYYSNNALYEATRLLKYYLGVWNENIRPLRTPVHRSVEFFTSKIAVGEPAISADNASVRDAVAQIMEWSNFQIVKPVQIRQMSKYGDCWRKVVSENGKVWHELIDANVVTDFKEDARGFLTEIRLDTPIMENGIQKTQTEFWTVEATTPYMAIWIHRLPEGSTIEQIQRSVDPVQYATLAEFGIDFVPFTRAAFQKDGSGWGKNSCEHALLKVDEANRQATRLHQMLFRYNKPTWAVSPNQVLPDGSPMPAPKLKDGTNADKTDGEVRDNDILYLPGTSTVTPLVPPIDYKAALEILLSQEKELRQDLPELMYYDLPDRADLSGKALRTLLGAAVDRAMQAQANYVESTVRANQMALTVGMYNGIFPAMGNFDDGSLAHSIRYQEPFPVETDEKAVTLQALSSALGRENLKLAMKLSGFSEEEIAEVVIPKPEPAQSPRTQA
jgi:hypothetical protein